LLLQPLTNTLNSESPVGEMANRSFLSILQRESHK
jgi:hypothetical protein